MSFFSDNHIKMSAPTTDSTEAITNNSGYGSSDETASLLVTTGPAVTVIVPVENRSVKPVLQRQDCTTHLRPQLSGGPGSEESAASVRIEDSTAATRSVPDIELQCRDQPADRPQTLISPVATCSHRGSVTTCQLVPHTYSRCRVCERRQSTVPTSALQLARSVSRESVRSALHYPCGCSSSLHAVSTCPVIQPPALLLPTTSTRIIRQSSQPESSACATHCPHHAHHHPSASLRQLREPGDGIAGIAADSLRINGGMRPFKQVSTHTDRWHHRSEHFQSKNFFILHKSTILIITKGFME